RKPSSLQLPNTAAVLENGEASAPFISILRDTTMRGVISFQMTYGLLFGTVLAFVGIWMRTAIVSSVVQVGIVLSVRSLLNGTLALPFGILADRFNRVVLVTGGMLMMAIGTIVIPWMESFGSILVLFMVIGVFESMAIPSAAAMTVETGRRLGMGSVMGVINMAMSLGLVIGSVLGGVVEGYLGIIAVFRWAAVLGLIGVIVFNLFMIRRQRLSD
ncbi:MAG: MFS transporter, partial [Candidatus Poribacteria bacterium]|nr:MFS transporter [Candidatus Poribacteria bacterium]